jgi:hypothetical protein
MANPLAQYGLMVTDPQRAKATRKGLMQVFSSLMAAGATSTDPGNFSKQIAGMGPNYSAARDASLDHSQRQNLMGRAIGREDLADKNAAEDRAAGQAAAARKVRLEDEALGRDSAAHSYAAGALRDGMTAGDANAFGYVDPPQGVALPMLLAKQKHQREMEEAAMKAGNPTGRPSSPIQNFRHRQKLVAQYGEGSPEVARFDTYVRASKWLDTGPSFQKPDPTGRVTKVIPKSLAPAQEPAYKHAAAAAAAAGTAEGKEHGEAAAKLSAMEAAMPRLDAAVVKLSEIGKTATYTKAGQGVNLLKRETGQDVGPGAVARASYIAHVNANILPLLKSTFGAQFTVAEGESLKATLGDPNMHPSEKDAVLAAFIENKKAEVLSLRRQTKGQGSMPQSAIDDGVTPAQWNLYTPEQKALYD